MPQRQNLTFQ